MEVKLEDYGLTHHESDSFVFVRSARSSRWETRPGVSAMFGWHFRGKRLLNFLAPRAGVNVALLDFDDDEKVEFGVGPTISLVQGGLIAGIGWNLSTDFRQKRYFFLGISFVNIANVIKREVQRARGGTETREEPAE